MSKIVQEMPHRRATDTEPMDRILLWAVQPQSQWRSISTELYPDRHRGWPPHPSQRSGGRSTITEEREVSWSWQHPSRTGPSRWRGCNPLSRQSATRFGRQENGQPHGPSPQSSHFSRKATCSSARTTEWPATSAIRAKSSWRSYWTDWSREQRRSSLKNKQASEQEGPTQSRSLT